MKMEARIHGLSVAGQGNGMFVWLRRLEGNNIERCVYGSIRISIGRDACYGYGQYQSRLFENIVSYHFFRTTCQGSTVLHSCPKPPTALALKVDEHG